MYPTSEALNGYKRILGLFLLLSIFIVCPCMWTVQSSEDNVKNQVFHSGVWFFMVSGKLLHPWSHFFSPRSSSESCEPGGADSVPTYCKSGMHVLLFPHVLVLAQAPSCGCQPLPAG